MKRVFALIAVSALLLSGSFSAEAKIKVGVKGGVNITNVNIKDLNLQSVTNSYTGWNLGVTANVPLVLGFAIQPELIYSTSGTKAEINAVITSIDGTFQQGDIQLPVNIQWGITLGPIRPFAQLTPFIGYSITNSWKSDFLQLTGDLGNVDKFHYGVGVGAGIQLGDLQFSFTYKWGLDPTEISFEKASNIVLNTKAHGASISLAYLF